MRITKPDSRERVIVRESYFNTAQVRVHITKKQVWSVLQGLVTYKVSTFALLGMSIISIQETRWLKHLSQKNQVCNSALSAMERSVKQCR